MRLDKWSSNHPDLVKDLASNPLEQHTFNYEEEVAALGIQWSPQADAFTFKVQCQPIARAVTKRAILSEIAKLYDPLGWLSPVIVRAKILLQHLWIIGNDWDAQVSPDIQSSWHDFQSQLSDLEVLKIPRWFGTTSTSGWQIHGFADASERAYAAVVYIVAHDSANLPVATLVAAKSKIAPIKSVSIPRLELCGALLLSKLLVRTLKDFNEPDHEVCCWTDSQVVLAWLKGHPSSWKTFVANRVSEILSLLPRARWQHVRSAHNPADLATRGLTPNQLASSQLWWNGPHWLTDHHKMTDPVESTEIVTTLERRSQTSVFHTSHEDNIESIISRFSSFKRLLNVLSYVRRWRTNVGLAPKARPPMHLGVTEITNTRLVLIRRVQEIHFSAELSSLRGKTSILRGSPLRRLLPFLDGEELPRVGGRLHFSYLPYQEKHPVILPSSSHLAELLIREAHEATLHGGPQLMQSHLQREFWIIRARNKILVSAFDAYVFKDIHLISRWLRCHPLEPLQVGRFQRLDWTMLDPFLCVLLKAVASGHTRGT